MYTVYCRLYTQSRSEGKGTPSKLQSMNVFCSKAKGVRRTWNGRTSFTFMASAGLCVSTSIFVEQVAFIVVCKWWGAASGSYC